MECYVCDAPVTVEDGLSVHYTTNKALDEWLDKDHDVAHKEGVEQAFLVRVVARGEKASDLPDDMALTLADALPDEWWSSESGDALHLARMDTVYETEVSEPGVMRKETAGMRRLLADLLKGSWEV